MLIVDFSPILLPTISFPSTLPGAVNNVNHSIPADDYNLDIRLPSDCPASQSYPSFCNHTTSSASPYVGDPYESSHEVILPSLSTK